MNIRGAIAKTRAIAAGELARDEKGQILIIVLVFLVLGAIIITPLLSYMITGVRATGVYQRNNLELYAAEAGVRDAMWNIQTAPPELPGVPSDGTWQYPLPANVNDLPVTVAITRVDLATFRVISRGGSASTGTTIECYVKVADFTDLLGNGATSRESITYHGTINGDCQAPLFRPMGKGEITGDLNTDPVTNWPTEELFKNFYGGQVDKDDPYQFDTLALLPETGPLYWQGTQLKISGTTKLVDTVYVAGDLYVEQTTSIDMNYQTIFVEGGITFKPGAQLTGIGCIISIQHIDFQPNPNGENDFIFVMSVNQGVDFAPPASAKDYVFKGSVAGDTNLTFQPGMTLTHWGPPDGLNLPGESGNVIMGVEAWKVTPPMNPSLYVATSSLPNAAGGVPYSETLVASGGENPYTWSVAAGSLPDGLSLDSSTGEIYGTPIVVDTFTFTVEATDSASPAATAGAELSITVDPGLIITVTTAALSNGYLDAAYEATLTAAGGAPLYTWLLMSGSLPYGLSLSLDGVISGTPTPEAVTYPHTYTFRVLVTDSASPTPATATKLLAITIKEGLNVSTSSLPRGWVGVAYSEYLAAAGGEDPYTWSVTGSLPDGLSLDSATGEIYGTPIVEAVTYPHTYALIVQVTDSTSPTPSTASRALSIQIGTVPTVTTDGVVVTHKGSTYTATLNATLTYLGGAGGSCVLDFQWATVSDFSDGTVDGPGSWGGAVPYSYSFDISVVNNTPYYYRAYVIGSDGGIAYGLTYSFEP